MIDILIIKMSDSGQTLMHKKKQTRCMGRECIQLGIIKRTVCYKKNVDGGPATSRIQIKINDQRMFQFWVE